MPNSVPERLPRLERWYAGGRTFSFNGQDIFFVDSAGTAGSATLLLLHGFPTASFDWHPMWDSLAKRFRVVAGDMLGFGFSAKPLDGRYSIAIQADLFEALAQHLGLREVHLLAHDYGDTVGQELLARHLNPTSGNSPKLLIRSVILLNGGLFPETHRALLIQKLLASSLGPLIARVMNERGFHRRFAGIFGPATKPTTAELAEYWALATERGGKRLFPKLIGYIAERRKYRERWVGALQKANVPLRLIDGLVDPISGAHMVARYRELIPNPDIVELPTIGHYPQVEASDKVLQAVMEFHDHLVK
jgi:pimeloyl-ACP methyl ester carboxylesterase